MLSWPRAALRVVALGAVVALAALSPSETTVGAAIAAAATLGVDARRRR